jgi:hypothetical protein
MGGPGVTCVVERDDRYSEVTKGVKDTKHEGRPERTGLCPGFVLRGFVITSCFRGPDSSLEKDAPTLQPPKTESRAAP